MFYRKNSVGNAVIFENDGSVATRIMQSKHCVYPVGSNMSTKYEHPVGVVLSVEDAQKLGILEEN
ncbi:MAG: hypothetical protein KAI70_00555 [Candidatus Omnitrophica bacterium]|nr:hypothetical protein [Candidatus Omnitrophota bacterium]